MARRKATTDVHQEVCEHCGWESGWNTCAEISYQEYNEHLDISDVCQNCASTNDRRPVMPASINGDSDGEEETLESRVEALRDVGGNWRT